MIQVLVLIILILLNAFFAASEMAFVSLNDAKIEKEAKTGLFKGLWQAILRLFAPMM